MDAAAALTPEGVLHRVRWRVVRRLDGRLQGDYRSIFRGSGLDFTDLREYVPGDDLRHLDWNVTARMDVPYVRQFVEDREVTAWLVLDSSPSMAFGPADRQKSVVTAEIAAALGQILVRGGNAVGAMVFDGSTEQGPGGDPRPRIRTIRPAQGRRQVLRILSVLLDGVGANAERPAPTDLGALLRTATGVLQRRSLVVLVSDFITDPGWERPLSMLARRHDVVAIQVLDRREFDLPDAGPLWIEDAETGEQIFVDTSDAAFRTRLSEAARARQAELSEVVTSSGTELHSVLTDEDLVRALARIADLRARRRR